MARTESLHSMVYHLVPTTLSSIDKNMQDQHFAIRENSEWPSSVWAISELRLRNGGASTPLWSCFLPKVPRWAMIDRPRANELKKKRVHSSPAKKASSNSNLYNPSLHRASPSGRPERATGAPLLCLRGIL